jgi:hypothetical protein
MISVRYTLVPGRFGLAGRVSLQAVNKYNLILPIIVSTVA